MWPVAHFLPLDDAIASKEVFVIIALSGLDGRTDGRKRFWSQLNNFKTVRDRLYVSMGELIGIHGRATEWAHPDSHVPQTGVVNRRPQNEHIMWGRQAAWSLMWWLPCTKPIIMYLVFIMQCMQTFKSSWLDYGNQIYLKTIIFGR